MPGVALAIPVSLPQCPLIPRSISEHDSDPEFNRSLEPRPQGCSQATADHSRGQGPKDLAQPIQAVPLPSPPLASSGGAGDGGRGRTAHPPASSRVPGPVDRAQSTPGQPQKKSNPSLASNGVDRAQPTLGGWRGPRSLAGGRSVLPCCGGRCRGRCGSFSPRQGPAAPGSSRRVGRGTSGTEAWRSPQHRLSRLADPGTVLPALGVPSWDLKGPSLIPDCQTLCSDRGF